MDCICHLWTNNISALLQEAPCGDSGDADNDSGILKDQNEELNQISYRLLKGKEEL